MRTAVLFSATAVLCGLSSTAIAAERTRSRSSDTPCVLEADFDRDSRVGISDYLSLLGAFGSSSAGHDLDGNGTVGTTDLQRLLQSYGRTEAAGDCDPERENIDYDFVHVGNTAPDAEGYVHSVSFEAVVRRNIQNLKMCWKEDGQWGNPCWYNQFLITDGAANLQTGIIDYGNAEPTWLGETQMHIGVAVNVNPDTASDLDPIECGVAYNYELQNGIWNDDEVVTIPCADEGDTGEVTSEDEACTECPYGGTYDGANCFVGTAPAGSTAGYNATLGVWTYTPDSGTCGDFDEALRDGSCVWAEVPAGADAFAYGPTNGFYTAPECE